MLWYAKLAAVERFVDQNGLLVESDERLDDLRFISQNIGNDALGLKIKRQFGLPNTTMDIFAFLDQFDDAQLEEIREQVEQAVTLRKIQTLRRMPQWAPSVR